MALEVHFAPMNLYGNAGKGDKNNWTTSLRPETLRTLRERYHVTVGLPLTQLRVDPKQLLNYAGAIWPKTLPSS